MTIPIIVKTTYTTQDGAVFDSKKDAENHIHLKYILQTLLDSGELKGYELELPIIIPIIMNHFDIY